MSAKRRQQRCAMGVRRRCSAPFPAWQDRSELGRRAQQGALQGALQTSSRLVQIMVATLASRVKEIGADKPKLDRVKFESVQPEAFQLARVLAELEAMKAALKRKGE